MIRLHEHGLIVNFERQAKRTFKPAIDLECNSFKAMSAEPGGFEEIYIACGILVLGITSGICTLLLEIVWDKCRFYKR